MKPQSTLKLNGSLDLSREGIDQQKPKLSSGKISKPIRKSDSLGPFGKLDLSRPESINTQIPELSCKSSKMHPKHNLRLKGNTSFFTKENEKKSQSQKVDFRTIKNINKLAYSI